MADLFAEDLTLAYEDEEVIRALSLAVPPRQITALVGPNGSGKSTLLKGLARLMKPRGGAVYLDGQAIHRMKTRQVARRLAILPQRPEAPDGLTVWELVALGRFPHQGLLGVCREEDDARVRQALKIAGIGEFAERSLGELSGGQRQLAWIAMALAQDTGMLLLDEPTTFLDIAHQLQMLDVLDRLQSEHDCTVVMVLHDINQAARHAQHMVALAEGRVFRSGPPCDILTPDVLAGVFGIEAKVLVDEDTGCPYCIPLSCRPTADPASARVL